MRARTIALSLTCSLGIIGCASRTCSDELKDSFHYGTHSIYPEDSGMYEYDPRKSDDACRACEETYGKVPDGGRYEACAWIDPRTGATVTDLDDDAGVSQDASYGGHKLGLYCRRPVLSCGHR